MCEDGFETAQLRDGETRDDSAHASDIVEQQLAKSEAGDPCPDCDDGVLENPNCPTCPNCGWSTCYGGPADV